jgi:hypothetical protein
VKEENVPKDRRSLVKNAGTVSRGPCSCRPTQYSLRNLTLSIPCLEKQMQTENSDRTYTMETATQYTHSIALGAVVYPRYARTAFVEPKTTAVVVTRSRYPVSVGWPPYSRG